MAKTFQYQWKSGDTLESVAKFFKTTLDSLLKTNPGGYPFSTGQGIKVPNPYRPLGWANPALQKPASAYALKPLQTGPYRPPGAGPNPAMTKPTYPGPFSFGAPAPKGAPSPVGVPKPTPKGPPVKLTDFSQVDRTSGNRVDPVTGLANTPTSSLTYTVQLPDGSTQERPYIFTANELDLFRRTAGMTALTRDDAAQMLGYTKFGGTYVYVGGEVNLPSEGGDGGGSSNEPWYAEFGVTRNKPGYRGNRSGKNFRNANGTLMRWNNKRGTFVTGSNIKRRVRRGDIPGSKETQGSGVGNARDQSINWNI